MSELKADVAESIKNHPKLLGLLLATSMYLTAGVGSALAAGAGTTTGP